MLLGLVNANRVQGNEKARNCDRWGRREESNEAFRLDDRADQGERNDEGASCEPFQDDLNGDAHVAVTLIGYSRCDTSRWQSPDLPSSLQLARL